MPGEYAASSPSVGSLCEAAGMPGEYAASSPRVGKAIDLADSGMSVEDLRAYGRWRSWRG